MKITYFAKGLLEFRMNINLNGAILKINFTGGTMGSNGVIPARYETDNPAIQKIIRESPQFKSGKILALPSKDENSGNKNSL